jgi:putative oxidoreductase
VTGAERLQAAYRRVAGTKDVPVARDVALLGVRLVLAFLFIWHGARTLFGAFGGPGVHQASVFYGTIAHLHPATFFTVLSGGTEFFGGVAVGLGVLGRLAAAGIIFDMIGAMVTVTFANGLPANATAPGGGYELNLALAALALPIAVLGTGRLSLDEALRSRWQRSPSPVGHPGDVRYDDRPRQVPAP